MKSVLSLFAIIMINYTVAAQQMVSITDTNGAKHVVGAIDISDWFFFSLQGTRQIKSIDQSTLFAFHSNGRRSGLLVFDKQYDFIKHIQVGLENEKRFRFLDDVRSKFYDFPYTCYRPDKDALVVTGYIKKSAKEYSVIALVYNISTRELMKVEELRTASSDNFFIRQSKNDNYFLVGELLEKGKDDDIVAYDVFNNKGIKIYSAEGEWNKEKHIKCFLSDNGELLHYTADTKSPATTHLFSRFDTSGQSTTISFIPDKKDVFDYYGFELIRSPEGQYLGLCMKSSSSVPGFSILKLDFENKSVKKIVDRNLDKATCSRLNATQGKLSLLVDKKNRKPFTKADDYKIAFASAEADRIFIVMQHSPFHNNIATEHPNKVFESNGIIAGCYDYSGIESWISFYDRRVISTDSGLDYYEGLGNCANISFYETNDNIKLLLKTEGRFVYTSIDKKTGKDIEPVILFKDGWTDMNPACVGWIDEDEFIMTTCKSPTAIGQQPEKLLRSYKINNSSL